MSRCIVPALALLLSGCSTLAPAPVSQECAIDEDCADGTVCDPFQGACVSGDELPPRALLAFDIRERAAGETLFRVEIKGCDQEVRASDEGFRQLEIRRSEVSQTFLLFEYNRPVIVPEGDPTAVVVDPDAPTADEIITARFEITQGARLGLPPTPLERDVVQSFTTEDVPTRSRVPWPRYSPFDVDRPPPYLVWETFPTLLGPLPVEGEPPALAFAPVYRMLVPPDTYIPAAVDGSGPQPCQVPTDCCDPRGDCTPGANVCIVETGECTLIGNPEFSPSFSYQMQCNRQVEGTVARFDISTGEIGSVLDGASVRLRYADPDPEVGPRLGVAPFGLSPAEGCESAAQCGEGRLCDEASGRCLLALDGRNADTGTSTNAEGEFSTQVYSYCEADPESPIDRRYRVLVSPAAESGLPSVTLDAKLSHAIPGALTRIGQPLCVPDWGDPVDLQLPLQGAPQTLAGGGDAASYRCCDVGCLPSQLEDAAAGPPPAPGACGGRTAAGASPTVRFEAPLLITAEESDAWLQADCLPPALPAGDGPYQVGTLRSDANCPADGRACVAAGLAGGSDGEDRIYAVRIQSPTGSVLASRDLQVAVSAGTVALDPVTLPPRVLVRGTVDVDAELCELRDDPSDCASRAAVVLAERVRMPGEDVASVPGPYLHQVATFFDPIAGRDGAYVMPLDPGGVYVMTALPAPGEDGGPSRFQIVDLRDGPPAEDRPFVLDKGILVTLDLASFDRRTFVVPLDTGSFLQDTLMHPVEARPLDLNAITECLTPPQEGAQGCKIRQLVPPGSTVSVSQVGLARFTARQASGSASCASSAP